MLVAIAGSQSSGKTTTLNALQSIGYKVITRKSARSVLEEWNVSLAEVNADEELTKKFQEEITRRKYEDEKHAIKSKEVWFTERSHVDLFTYALISLGKNNSHNDWINQYYYTCRAYNDQYDSIFYLTAGHFKPANDGVRGFNQHYSKMVDATMFEFMKTMTNFKGDGSGQSALHEKLQIVHNAKLKDRVFLIRMHTFGSIYPADKNLVDML